MKRRLSSLWFVLVMVFTLIPPGIAANSDTWNEQNADAEIMRDQQQNRVVSGVVKSSDDQLPIPGVNVQIKGSTAGTITDVNGTFEIEVPGSDAELIFSFIGFTRQEILVGTRDRLEIVLVPEVSRLDEVVVVGYGTMKKSDLSGSIVSISSDDFKDQPVTNITQAMQGRLAGVNVVTNSGAPGGSVKVRIRGINSMKGSNDPLYVVDGVPLNININDLNVNDIQSMEVLKDASATAIYGSRGANGVVMITTKRGKQEKAQLQVNMNTGFSFLTNKYDVMEAGTFAEVVNLYRPDYYSSEDIARFKREGGVDWQDEIYQTGRTNDLQFSLMGGSGATNYYISGNYVDQTGIVLNTSESKYSFRSNVTSEISEKLKVDFNLSAGRKEGLNNTENGGKNSPTWNAVIYSPTFPVYTETGEYNRQDILASPNATNPVMMLKERHFDYLVNTITFNGKMSYAFVPELTLDVVLATDFKSNESGEFQNQYISSAATSAYKNESKSYTWTNQNILTYKKTFNSIHDLSVTAVNEQTSFNYNGFRASGVNISPISVGYDNLGIAVTQNASSWKSKTTMQSYVGRLSYGFKNRYLLTATYRADGTSKFQGDNKWGYFPSAAASWRVSEEPFLKGSSLISNFKVRGSWGLTGNQGIDAYATISRIAALDPNYGLSQTFPGSIVQGLDNPDLKWETTEQVNLGVDLSFWNNRLNVTADYYDKKTTDLLHSVVIPVYNGGGSVNKNIGEMSNKGVEVVISGTPVDGEAFKWETGFNISHFKNELLSLGTDSILPGSSIAGSLADGSAFTVQVGEPLGAFYGYKWLGIYTTDEASEAAAMGFAPGDNKFLDYNQNGSIDGGDKHIIGYASPDFVWGWNNNFTYRDFELNLFIQGVHGREVLNSTYASAATILPDATSITHPDGADFWRPDNENARFAYPLSGTNKKFLNTTQFLQDGSFIKLRNIALAYNLRRDLLKHMSLKLTMSVQNALTISKYKGYDPEISTSTGDLDGAIDIGAYPVPRTFNFGIQATF